MPIPPSFVSLQEAVAFAARYLNSDPTKALAALVDAFCDGAVETWGGMKGEEPRRIHHSTWINFKYKKWDIPYDVVEIYTLSLFIWLGLFTREQLETASEAASVQTSIADVVGAPVEQDSEPTSGEGDVPSKNQRPVSDKDLRAFIEGLPSDTTQSYAVTQANEKFPDNAVSRERVRKMVAEVHGTKKRGPRAGC